MSHLPPVHPSAVLEALVAKGGRSTRIANLKRVHEICGAHHRAGSKDFTISVIGRLIEAAGILSWRALYNAASEDYRSLINAWAGYTGPAEPKQANPALASHDYLMRIPDPAVRSIMQSTIAERDRLKAQLNLLKAGTQLTIDRRPVGVEATSSAHSVTVLAPTAQLTPTEHEALSKSVSPAFLQERGLREGSHGEIVNERGRTIFDVGFARAVRKLLGA